MCMTHHLIRVALILLLSINPTPALRCKLKLLARRYLFCIYGDKFEKPENFIFCAIPLIESENIDMYIARGSDWKRDDIHCLHYVEGGGKTGSYYEISFAKKYATDIEQFKFENYVKHIRG